MGKLNAKSLKIVTYSATKLGSRRRCVGSSISYPLFLEGAYSLEEPAAREDLLASNFGIHRVVLGDRNDPAKGRKVSLKHLPVRLFQSYCVRQYQKD